MTEQHEVYRVVETDPISINRIFDLIADRLDRIEGLRGTPQVYTSEIEYPGQTLTGFLKGGSESADFTSVTTSDLGLTTLEIGAGYLKITDANDQIIHQLGDE